MLIKLLVSVGIGQDVFHPSQSLNLNDDIAQSHIDAGHAVKVEDEDVTGDISDERDLELSKTRTRSRSRTN